MSLRSDSIATRLFTDRGQALRAVQKLVESGIDEHNIRLAPSQSFADESEDLAAGTHADSGALVGAFIGGLMGGMIGFALWAGVVPVVAAIPLSRTLATFLTSAAMGAALCGLLGLLVGWRIPKSAGNHYADRLERGGLLVTVHAGRKHLAAIAILDSFGGVTE